MRKQYKVTWSEYHTVIVEAEDEESAIEKAQLISREETYECNDESYGGAEEVEDV